MANCLKVCSDESSPYVNYTIALKMLELLYKKDIDLNQVYKMLVNINTSNIKLSNKNK